MKFIFILLFPILMAETCSQNNEQDKDISFTYETMTRGSRANYILTKKISRLLEIWVAKPRLQKK